MNILYITDIDEKGGAFLAFIDLLESLLGIQSEITPIILTTKNGKNNKFAQEHGIENYCVGHKAFTINFGSTRVRRFVRFILRPLLRLRYEIANRNAVRIAESKIDFSTIDLIHSNTNRNDLGAILAKKHSIPHVWHLRESAVDCFFLKNDYIKFMNENSTCFIAISKSVGNAWEEKGLHSEKIHIIYDGVKTSACERINNMNRYMKKGVIAGFISPFKGQYDLIKTINLIKKELDNRFQLDIYGHVALEYLIKLKVFVFFHGLTNIVKFKGYIKDVDKLFGDYDIGFMCSKDEGFGRVTVEYMMNGLCVIASNTGANQEIIRDGINGYIYKYKDNNNLAEKLSYVLENNYEMLECAKQGFEDATKNYTREKNAEKIIDLYHEILKEKACR